MFGHRLHPLSLFKLLILAIFIGIPALAFTQSQLINLSTRGWAGSGGNEMIAGFIIANGSKTVLVRADGPSLAAYGVPNVLFDPTLTLYSGQTAIAYNDDWQNSSQAAAIQASGLAPTNPRESAILATLAPGPYTAVVRGLNNTTGNALVGVFAGSGGGGGGTVTLRVRNQGSHTIWNLYVTPASSSSWGSDLLGSNTMPPNTYVDVTGIACPGIYDARVRYSDGHIIDTYNWSFSCGNSYTWTLYY